MPLSSCRVRLSDRSRHHPAYLKYDAAMTVPFPGLEPAPAISAPDIIEDVADCLGGYSEFVLFGALQDGIPHPDHAAYIVYAVRSELLIFTEITWCPRPPDGLPESRISALMHASTGSATRRVDDNAFDIGEVYLSRM